MRQIEVLQALRAGELSADEAKSMLAQAAAAPVSTHVEPGQNNDANLAEPQADQSAIAIVGASGRYPGAADLAEYWDNLAAGRNSVREIPPSRWDVEKFYDPRPGEKGKVYCKWMGMLDDIEYFDPLFFKITPAEAEMMDPQHRLFLQEAYRAFEDAGYPPSAVSAQQCGVYLGIMLNEYSLLLAEHLDGQTSLSTNSFALAAARIAYFLNLKGPALPVDTACSSSLVAVHLACQALRNREIDMALVGGVTLYLTSGAYVGMCSAGMLSPDGQCKAFDDSANGFVPGEGVAAMVLKRLADAERDGDHIHGVIIGSGINQDGKTNGITAPSANSQMQLEREIYRTAGIDPESISLVEMHGTGTKLGDPIELDALSTVFREHTDRKRFCAIGSVKSNIGHTSAAGALASVHKVLLCMQQRQLVPSLHFETPNEHFDFENSPFYVNTGLQAWESSEGQKRRAAVSSFGFSGTNAHLVIEEYRPAPSTGGMPRSSGADKPLLFVLSARGETELRTMSRRLRDFLLRTPNVNLSDVAYTLQAAREPMPHRLAVIAETAEALAGALDDFLAGKASPRVKLGHLKRGQSSSTSRSRTELAAAVREKDLLPVAEAWLAGAGIDWAELYTPQMPRRIPLPTYPFARTRYWVPGAGFPSDPGENDESLATAGTPPARNTEGFERSNAQRLLRKTWRRQPASDRGELPAGCILVLGTERTRVFTDALQKQLKSQEILPVYQSCESDQVGISADFFSAEATHRCTLEIDDALGERYLVGVVDVTALDTEYSDGTPIESGKLGILQHLIASFRETGFALLQVTSNLVDFRQAESSLRGASLAGLYAMLGAEYKRVRSKTMDTDSIRLDAPDLIAQVIDELAGNEHVRGGACVYRGGERFVPELTELPRDLDKPDDLQFGADDVVLITGGTRGIGAEIARYVRSCGADKLAIWGREDLPPASDWQEIVSGAQSGAQREKLSRFVRLQNSGARVHYAAPSLDDFSQIEASVKEVVDTLGQITHVFHCAGRLSEAPAFYRKPVQDIEAVCSPKVQGVLGLHAALEAMDLKAFVLFSSVSTQIPALAVGQSDYAMANAFMDAWSRHQHALGNPKIISIQWPAWAETGMAAGQEQRPALRATGITNHSTAEGLQLLALAMQSGLPACVPCVVNPDVFDAASLLEEDATPSAPPADPKSKSVAQEAPDADAGLKAAAMDWLRAIFVSDLKLDEDQLDPSLPFDEFGIDSIVFSQLVNTMQGKIGSELDPALLLQYGTLDALAGYFVATHAEAFEAPPEEASGLGAAISTFSNQAQSSEQMQSEGSVSPKGARGAEDDVAVIGISCRFPGAPSKDAFWRLLAGGSSAIRPLGSDRWNNGNGKAVYGGWVADIDKFDPAYYRIKPADAAIMDPQARVILDESVKAIYDAGYESSELAGRRVGVFIGGRSQQGVPLTEISKAPNPVLGIGQNYMATNISRFFDFRGPSLVVDTACSSGLASIGLACDALHAGRIDTALAGAVSLLLNANAHELFSARDILNQDGQFRLFDKRAAGEVLGEGAGVVILKRLSQAIADGDQVYGILKSLAVNNDGRTLGPGSPNFEAQKGVMRDGLSGASLAPGDITFIEVNGGGSPVVDSVEIKAISEVYGLQNRELGPCFLGSVKPNIGHLLISSSIASFIRCNLSLHNKQVPPFLSALEPFDHFDFQNSRVNFNRDPISWNGAKADPRRFAQNSFPDGGTNCHAILEEFLPPAGYQQKRFALSPPVTNPIQFPLAGNGNAVSKGEAEPAVQTAPEPQDLNSFLAAFTKPAGAEEMRDRQPRTPAWGESHG